MNGTRTIGRRLLTALLVPAVLMTSHSASAAASGVVKWGTLPTFSVVGNGTEYTQMEPTVGGAWEAEFEITSEGATRIKSWEVYPYKPQEIGSPAINLSQYAASKSYPFGKRPKNVHRTVGQIFPTSHMAAYAVARCNHNLYVLQNQGLSNSAIFSQEHKVSDTFWVGLSIDTTVGKVVIEGSLHGVNVICKAYDAPEPPDPPAPATSKLAAPTFQVTGASLSVLLDGHSIPTKAERDCPVELNFLGHIQVKGTALPATVQYRFDFGSGEKSTVFSKVVKHTDASALISHQIAIPLAGMPGSGAQSGAGSSGAGTGGFAQLQSPPSPPGPLPEGVPEQQPGPMIKGATLPDNEYKNDVRLVVLTHGGAISAPAGYHIVCKPKVNEGISGPAGMSSPQNPPLATGDPDHPYAIGTVPNPPATRGEITLKRGVTDDKPAQPPETGPKRLRSPTSPAPVRETEAKAAPEEPERESPRMRQR